MAKSEFKIAPKKFKVSAQHVIITSVLTLLFFIIAFYEIIPYGTSKFVVGLFKPSGDKLEKIGFAKFNGLCWASLKIKDDMTKIDGKGIEINTEYINKEYVFDFSFKERSTKLHGYVKGTSEFYAKSEVLGENAIILEPWLGFSILAIVVAVMLTLLISMCLPTPLGFMAVLFDRQIDNTKVKIRLQTGFADDIVDLLIMPDNKLAEKDISDVKGPFQLVWSRTVSDEIISPFTSPYHSLKFEDIFDDNTDLVAFRNEIIYGRIKEFFSDFVVKEIEDSKDGLEWRHNHLLFWKGTRLYMAHHFTEKYSNNVTGLAYGGAAFLIIAVGIRGLKFIPPTKPSFILLAIFLEFTMLSLLAVTLVYTEEEERMDKMLKKMEDANRSQLEVLRGQQVDIHLLANALIGQASDVIKARVENAISEYISSGDQVQRVIAEQIADKIMVGLREQAQTSMAQGVGRRR
ncbi:MAG: hypothetical protein HW421_2499 [Ignavibacteria bacterium]|nr:hypothetical protein [Ignavibacteria bacterium]